MVKKTRKKWVEIPEYVSIAAILVTISAMFAAVCWITSGKAGGTASDYKTRALDYQIDALQYQTEALGHMIFRLESSTEASTARVQAQTYLTQAGMYYAYADKENNENVKSYLENLGDTSITMSYYYLAVAENAENRAQGYLDAYENAMDSARNAIYSAENAMDSAKPYSQIADYRSTGALIFNVSAAIASCAVLVKRKELLYIYLPIFAIGAYHLVMSIL